MLQTIESEVVISQDGKLPEVFREIFGHTVRITVRLSEQANRAEKGKDDAERLMQFAGTINWPIDDPVEWQRQQRNCRYSYYARCGLLTNTVFQ